jgi:hypothetical protein
MLNQELRWSIFLNQRLPKVFSIKPANTIKIPVHCIGLTLSDRKISADVSPTTGTPNVSGATVAAG